MNFHKRGGLNWKDVGIKRDHSTWEFASSARASRAVGGRYEIYRYRHSTDLNQYESDGPVGFEVRYFSRDLRWNARWWKCSLLNLAEAKAAAEAHHEQQIGIPTE
jgi:hypothetical protein